MDLDYSTSIDREQLEKLDEGLKEKTGVNEEHLRMIGELGDLPDGFKAGTEA